MNVFIHIAKSGGTTIRQMYIDAFGADKVLVVSDFMKPSNTYPNVISSKNLKYLNNLYQFSAVIGHINMSDLAENAKSYGKLNSMTIHSCIRDPVDRLISDYNFMRAKVDHPRHQTSKTMPAFEYMMSSPANYHATRLGIGSYFKDSIGMMNCINCISIEDSVERIASFLNSNSTNALSLTKKNITEQRFPEMKSVMFKKENLLPQELKDIEKRHSLDLKIYKLSKRISQPIKFNIS